MKTDQAEKSGNQITRKEALTKAGKYAAFTAAAAVILLAPKQAQADSPGEDIDKTGKGWGDTGYTPPSGRPSPFMKPNEKPSRPSGLRDSPWK